jgi:predicted dehydrogenase
MPEQARVAFVGAGGHANNCLYPSLEKARTVKLVAICDLQADRAEGTAKRYGADRWYTDVDTMLDKEQLDGVCICGLPPMHVEVGKQVVRRGLPIFVEKPSALSADAARSLAETAAQAEVWGMVGFMKRHAPAYLLARQLMDAPEFGGVQQLHVRFTQGRYPDIWGFEAPQAFLIGQVVHIFDLTRFLGGDVAQVHARLHVVSKHLFAYAISLEFASGAIGTLELNTLDHTEPYRDTTERADVTGVGESVSVSDMQTVSYYSAKDWRSAETSHPDLGTATLVWSPNWLSTMHGKIVTGYVGELEHFAKCLLSGTPAAATLYDGVESLRLSEAVWESAQTGKPVEVARD